MTASNDFLQLFEVIEEVVQKDAGGEHVNGAANGEPDGVQLKQEESEEEQPAEVDGATQVSTLYRELH